MDINHYQLLGIPQDADVRRIKSAYRSMAKRFHPDANKGSETAAELFRQLNEAYRVLSNEQLRKAYDQKYPAEKVSQKPQTKRQQKAAPADPQKKFNQFLNTLLDAIFTAPDQPEEVLIQPAAIKPKTAQNCRQKPDFNFYYYLAMEKEKNPYQRDKDGIYRRQRKRSKPVR